jgi:hypothetical protein
VREDWESWALIRNDAIVGQMGSNEVSAELSLLRTFAPQPWQPRHHETARDNLRYGVGERKKSNSDVDITVQKLA